MSANDAHWDGDVLTLTIPRDPSSIHVQRAEGQPRKVYVGESESYGTCIDDTPTAIDVIRDIDQLRRDLSGYHGQLKAHNDLKKHCENQRKRIGELEEIGRAHV